jgi:hypothetical protein
MGQWPQTMRYRGRGTDALCGPLGVYFLLNNHTRFIPDRREAHGLGTAGLLSPFLNKSDSVLHRLEGPLKDVLMCLPFARAPLRFGPPYAILVVSLPELHC